MSHVLIVDDEPAICWAFRESLSDDGHEVRTAGNAEEAYRLVDEQRPDVVVLDVRLPGEDGLTMLRNLKQRIGDTPIVIMTAFGSLDTAVEAIEGGAFDYLPKPFDLDQAVTIVQRSLAARQQRTDRDDLSAVRDSSAPDDRDGVLIGSSAPMQTVFRRIALVSPSDVPVLITGESGTGKELVAEAIHRHSRRADQPFVPVCVPALSAGVIESELFGHVRGAFTGADRERLGLLDLADGGTVFLDEIGDVPLELQVKLLRAMERREVTPVGATQAHRSDFRIVAATNRDLDRLVREGAFREDLYYRLNVFQIELPPLRERGDDVLALASHFLETSGATPLKQLADDAMDELRSRWWHGNVRELRNAIEHAAILARGHLITRDCLPRPLEPLEEPGDSAGSPLGEAVAQWIRTRLAEQPDTSAEGTIYDEFLALCEPVLFDEALRQAGGNRSAAARLLGIHRETLRQKLRRHGGES